MVFSTSSLAGRRTGGPEREEREAGRESGRTLKTIQRERTRKKKDSEDSNEFSVRGEPRMLRIKRKSLILAQDERWRRA